MRLKKRVDAPVRRVRVMVDSRDSRRDLSVPLTDAARFYSEGLLAWDVAEGYYCTRSNRIESFLTVYPRWN